ncbi:microviridin/marinostatin family tricyclic proteinase inhibitor [Brasilonema sp. CT11]|nr:microviridin/marinostatin family tricyclic proteinase inhibitor [Brasilonema sp. CT11]
MSTNTVKASDEIKVPFFARFLEEQVSQESDKDKSETPAPPPPPFTFKYPSDWEDR